MQKQDFSKDEMIEKIMSKIDAGIKNFSTFKKKDLINLRDLIIKMEDERRENETKS